MHMWTTPIEWMYCIDRLLFTPLFVVPLLRYHNIYVCVCVLAGRALYNNWAAAQHRLIVDHHALCCSQLARDRSPRDFVVDTAWQNHMHDASYWWWWPKWRIYPRPQSQITWPSTEKKNKSHTNSIHTECIVFALDLANCLLWLLLYHFSFAYNNITSAHWARSLGWHSRSSRWSGGRQQRAMSNNNKQHQPIYNHNNVHMSERTEG